MPKKFIERLEKIDSYINNKSTGNSKELAQKLGLSIRSTKEFIKIMKELGAPIYYNRSIKSYCYTSKGYFNIKFITVQKGNTEQK